MTTIKLELDEKKHGAFNLYEDGSKIGEMTVSLRDDKLTVYHTGIDSSAEGKGYAKLLLEEMVKHSRENNLKLLRCALMYTHNLKGIRKNMPTSG